jgi:prepilin-type N-terminal cleavage/methylation domain-containing protein
MAALTFAPSVSFDSTAGTAAVLPAPSFHGARGFTLTEMAVVLLILTLLIGGMLMPLSAQDEVRRTAENCA